jgi:signal transduction histidine kinase
MVAQGLDVRPTHTFAAIAAGWIAAVAVVGMLVRDARDEALQRARQSSATLALVLEEHTARAFQAVSLMLDTVVDALQRTPGVKRNDPAFQALLMKRLHDLPYARAIFIIGPDGYILHDTEYPNTPNVSLADRPYFELHRDNPALDISIAAPLLSRSGLGWFVAVSRPVGRGRVFEGIVVAAVQPAYFETLFRRMALGAGDVMMLFNRDGVLVAQYPGGAESIGKPTASLIFSEHLPRSPSGTYRTRSGIFSYERVVSYRSVEGFPLVVGLSVSTDAFLAQWRRSALGAAIAMTALTLLLAFLVIHLVRQKKLRDRARERRAQAEKLEALGQLTGGIAHDFANLLNVISTDLHILSMVSGEAPMRTTLAVAQRAVARGTELVSHLLAFAKRQPLRLQPADLNALVLEAIELLRQAAGPRIEIVTELAPDLSRCLTDAAQLEVAIVNLVVNARDAMAGKGKIVLRTYDCKDAAAARPGARPADAVCLAVEDNGPGMSEEVRRRALEPFYTTKGEAGTGLGLSQVYGFMQQIGGSVRIESTPRAGTAVHLFFPKAFPAVAKPGTYR